MSAAAMYSFAQFGPAGVVVRAQCGICQVLLPLLLLLLSTGGGGGQGFGALVAVRFCQM